MQKRERNLKVYYASQCRSSSGIYGRTEYEQVPSIILRGKWLEEFGFDIDDHIQVSCSDGKLVISKSIQS